MAIKPVGGSIKSQEINDNLSYLDNRVSTIIATPVEGVSAQEIADSREGKNSLGDNVRDIRSKASTNLVNSITNGNFINGIDDHSITLGTATKVAVGIRLTNTSSNRNGARVFKKLLDNAPSNQVWYIKTRVRTLSSGANWIAVGIRGGNAGSDRSQIDNPVVGTWYDLSHYYDGSASSDISGTFNGAVWSYWQESIDRSIDVDYYLAINLTQAFGAGNEPNHEEMDFILKSLPYFEGNLGAGKLSEDVLKKYFETDKALNDLEEKSFTNLRNMLRNGNFNALTHWEAFLGAEIIHQTNKMIIRGTGSSRFPRVRQTMIDDYDVGDILFLSGNFFVSNNESQSIDYQIYANDDNNTATLNKNDYKGFEDVVSFGNITIPNSFVGNIRFQIRINYPSAAVADGKDAEVGNVMCINLTKFFGKGNEPTAEEMQKVVDLLFNGFVPERDEVRNVEKRLVNYVISNPGSGSVDLRKPTLAITFDDCFKSDIDVAYPILSKAGIKATCYVITSQIGQPNRLTWDDIYFLLSAGWNIECHTHDHLNLGNLSDAEIREQMELVNQAFMDNGLPTPKHHALPYGGGQDDQRVLDVVSEYRQTIRRTGGNPAYNTWINFDPLRIRGRQIDINDNNASRLNLRKNELDTTLPLKEIMFWFGHEFINGPGADHENNEIFFKELVYYGLENNFKFDTVNNIYLDTLYL